MNEVVHYDINKERRNLSLFVLFGARFAAHLFLESPYTSYLLSLYIILRVLQLTGRAMSVLQRVVIAQNNLSLFCAVSGLRNS